MTESVQLLCSMACSSLGKITGTLLIIAPLPMQYPNAANKAMQAVDAVCLPYADETYVSHESLSKCHKQVKKHQMGGHAPHQRDTACKVLQYLTVRFMLPQMIVSLAGPQTALKGTTHRPVLL